MSKKSLIDDLTKWIELQKDTTLTPEELETRAQILIKQLKVRAKNKGTRKATKGAFGGTKK